MSEVQRERDTEFWDEVNNYERLVELSRDIRVALEKSKKTIMSKMEITENGSVQERYNANKRVRFKTSSSISFSVTEMREKFGDEWVDENGKRSGSATLEVKHMRRVGPRNQQY
mgnify:FL=1